MRFIPQFLFVFIVGGLGGVIFMSAVLPGLQNFGPFRAISFLNGLGNGARIIERTERIVTQGQAALREAVNLQQNGILLFSATDKIGKQTFVNGVVLTNDGIVVTPHSIVQKNVRYAARRPEDWFAAEFLGGYADVGLAFFKVRDLRMKPVSFGNIKDLFAGQQIFLLARDENGEVVARDGIVERGADLDGRFEISSRLYEKSPEGASLFSIEGNFLGMFLGAPQEKETEPVSSQTIREFLEKTMREVTSRSGGP